jgi:L-serine/L-threonine ammonia-lyase
MPIHHPTPLLESDGFSTPTQRVWLKLECLQPSGSFKLRGIGHACEVHASRGARRLLSSSGGNAGIAVAYAGRHLGLPVTVVVPESTGERARSMIRRLGADVVVHGRSWMEANEHLLTLRQSTDAFVHPFDDPLVWAGHATLVAEAAVQGPQPDVVVLSVGGGGLMCGVLQGMHAAGWSDVPLVAVETVGAASLNAAMAAGGLVTLDAITSLATTLGARRVCDQAFEWTRRHEVHATTVTDHDAVQACLDVADEHRLIVEPACGAAVAATLQRRLAPLCTAANVLVILCGGLSTTYVDLLDMLGPVAPGRPQRNVASARPAHDLQTH